MSRPPTRPLGVKILRTELTEVLILEPESHTDARGWLMESFNRRRFERAVQALGLPKPHPFVQDNHTWSHRGVLRGLHYQDAPHAQGKMVRVLRGRAFDVAVDLRDGSPTFARWVGVELNAANRRQLWIPEGFAHGCLALEEGTEMAYKLTDYHAPECERRIRWNDPTLAISWPELGAGIAAPVLADTDAAAPFLR